MADDAGVKDAAAILRDAAQRIALQIRMRRSEYYTLRALTWGITLTVLLLLLKGLLGGYALTAALGPVALSLLAGLLYSLSRSVPPLDALRLADRAAGLHDRLSTALECVERRDESPLAKALIADAVTRAPRVDWARVVPRRWPREVRFLPASAAAAVLLLVLPPVPIPKGGLPALQRSAPAPQDEAKQSGPATSLDRPVERKQQPAERVERQPLDPPRRPTQLTYALIASTHQKVLNTSLRSAIHATDSTRSGCSANSAATSALGPIDPVMRTNRRKSSTLVNTCNSTLDR